MSRHMHRLSVVSRLFSLLSDNPLSPRLKTVDCGRVWARLTIRSADMACRSTLIHLMSSHPRRPSHRGGDPKNNRRKESRLSSRPFSRRPPRAFDLRAAHGTRCTLSAGFVGLRSPTFLSLLSFIQQLFLASLHSVPRYSPPCHAGTLTSQSFVRPSVSLLLSPYNSERSQVHLERGVTHDEKTCTENCLRFCVPCVPIAVL